MCLLLDRRAKLEQFLWDRLIGRSQDVDKPSSGVSTVSLDVMEVGCYLRPRVRLVVLSEQGDGLALLAGTSCPPDAMNVILNSQGKLQPIR